MSIGRLHRGPRGGLTLIECLVVIGLMGALVGLVLPAVQAAREAARHAQCSNNLRQIGLGVLSYHGINARLPMGEMPGGFSPHVAILPFVDRVDLYNSINFVVLNAPGMGANGRRVTWTDAISETSGGVLVGVYLCPSEVYSDAPEPGWTFEGRRFWPTNYAWNSGTWWPRSRSWDGLFGRSTTDARSALGGFPPLGCLGLNSCVDGLSQTLLISEVANGPIGPEGELERTRISECYAVRGIMHHASLDDALRLCDGVDWRGGEQPWGGRWRLKGYPWMEGTIWRTWFNTARTPNRTCCVDDSWVRGSSGGYWWFALKPASSYHRGVVNAAMADGSVRRVAETIHGATWMALSTRAGGEVIGQFD